jgi:hypothetical protein
MGCQSPVLAGVNLVSAPEKLRAKERAASTGWNRRGSQSYFNLHVSINSQSNAIEIAGLAS